MSEEKTITPAEKWQAKVDIFFKQQQPTPVAVLPDPPSCTCSSQDEYSPTYQSKLCPACQLRVEELSTKVKHQRLRMRQQVNTRPVTATVIQRPQHPVPCPVEGAKNSPDPATSPWTLSLNRTEVGQSTRTPSGGKANENLTYSQRDPVDPEDEPKKDLDRLARIARWRTLFRNNLVHSKMATTDSEGELGSRDYSLEHTFT